MNQKVDRQIWAPVQCNFCAKEFTFDWEDKHILPLVSVLFSGECPHCGSNGFWLSNVHGSNESDHLKVSPGFMVYYYVGKKDREYPSKDLRPSEIADKHAYKMSK